MVSSHYERYKETQKRYYERNKEKLKLYATQYHRRNSEKRLKYSKAYYQENKENINQQCKEWYQNNKIVYKFDECKCGNFKTKTANKCNICSLGKGHYGWKGDNVKYSGLHNWIKTRKPKPKFCEGCEGEKLLDLANISGGYKRNINDYRWLCHKCHVRRDNKIKND